jgi:hypothetical protein
VDDDGNPVIVGFVSDSSGENEWYVASYSPDGVERWEVTGIKGFPYNVELDSKNNIVVAGMTEKKSSDEDWYVASYSPTGVENWHASYDSGKGNDMAVGLAIDSAGNAVVAGAKAISSSSGEWYVVSYSPLGSENWSASGLGLGALDPAAVSVAIDGMDNAIVGGGISLSTSTYTPYLVSYSSSGVENWHVQYTSSGGGFEDVAVDVNSGDVLAFAGKAGYIASATASGTITFTGLNGYFVNFQGTGSISRVLNIGDLRVIDPAPESPVVDDGSYLGFGSVATGGNLFKVEAGFPRYVVQNSNSVHIVPVKIFIAAQLPDNYSVLRAFTETDDLVVVPPAPLLSWRKSITSPISKVILPEVNITTPGNELPVGVHYWYTLVVPDTVPDDLSLVDWNNTPWEITLSIFEVH